MFLGSKLDLYAGVHKGQRGRMSSISMKAGAMDYNDKASLDGTYNELIAFQEHMRLHASLEEKFIHPVLSERVPGGARILEEEHQLMHQQLAEIVAQFDGIRSKANESGMRSELVLEFYRAWNRFISFYLGHINREEEDVQPTLWKICTDKELAETLKAILAGQTPEEAKYSLQMMLPAMNLYERAELLNAAKMSMPPPAFQGVLRLIELALNPDDWKTLKTKVGID